MRPDVFALAAALGAVFFFANADDSVSSTNNLVSKEDQNAKTSPRDVSSLVHDLVDLVFGTFTFKVGLVVHVFAFSVELIKSFAYLIFG